MLRNWDFGKYTAHSENMAGDELFSISWNDGTPHVLEGTEVLLVSYKIDSDSLYGNFKFLEPTCKTWHLSILNDICDFSAHF